MLGHPVESFSCDFHHDTSAPNWYDKESFYLYNKQSLNFTINNQIGLIEPVFKMSLTNLLYLSYLYEKLKWAIRKQIQYLHSFTINIQVYNNLFLFIPNYFLNLNFILDLNFKFFCWNKPSFYNMFQRIHYEALR